MYEDRSLRLYASVVNDWKIKCVHSSQLFLFHQKKPIVGDTPYGLSCSKRLFRKVFSYVPPVRYARPLDHLVGGAVASWSVRWTPDLAVRVLKAPGNYRTVKLFCFPFQMGVLKRF